MPGQSESTPIRRAVVGPPAVFRRDTQPIGGVRYTYRPAPTGGLEIGAEVRGHCGGTGSEQLTAQRAQPESAGQTATMPSRPSVDTTISRKDRLRAVTTILTAPLLTHHRLKVGTRQVPTDPVYRTAARVFLQEGAIGG